MWNNSTAPTSAYGTIRAAPPPSPAVPVADPSAPPRASSPPSYGAATIPAGTSPAPPWATAFTSAPPSSGYVKVPTEPAPVPAAVASAVPPPPAQVPTLAPQSPASRVSDLFTRIKEQGQTLIAARRPWQELLHPPSFSSPANTGDAINRIRRNTSYFRANYILCIITVFLLGLFYHPFSLFAFAILCAAWFFLYFSREGPLVILGHTFDDGSVLATLGGATVIALLFTDVGWNVIGSFIVGAAVVLIHASFRSTDDLFLNEQEAAGGGLVAGAANQGLSPFVRIV